MFWFVLVYMWFATRDVREGLFWIDESSSTQTSGLVRGTHHDLLADVAHSDFSFYDFQVSSNNF